MTEVKCGSRNFWGVQSGRVLGAAADKVVVSFLRLKWGRRLQLGRSGTMNDSWETHLTLPNNYCLWESFILSCLKSYVQTQVHKRSIFTKVTIWQETVCLSVPLWHTWFSPLTCPQVWPWWGFWEAGGRRRDQTRPGEERPLNTEADFNHVIFSIIDFKRLTGSDSRKSLTKLPEVSWG